MRALLAVLVGLAIAEESVSNETAPVECDCTEAVTAAQARHGRAELAARVEGVFAGAARTLAAEGVTRIEEAGGETSGAVVEALAPESFEIGPEIDPGVPALKAGAMALALKSGNFGQEDFFERALEALKA